MRQILCSVEWVSQLSYKKIEGLTVVLTLEEFQPFMHVFEKQKQFVTAFLYQTSMPS